MGDDEKMSNGEIEKLEKMIDDAAKEGYSLIICSSYRDYERQNELQKEELHECDYEPERNALLKKYKRLTVQMEELKKLKRKKND